MSDTWNFQCWQPTDWGPDASEARHQHGALFEIGPGADAAATQTQPFTDTMTVMFSFYQRAGWSDTDGIDVDGMISLGSSADTNSGLAIYFGQTGSDYRLHIDVWDEVAGAYRYQIILGDEDGINWNRPNKWYQCAVSFDSSGISYCVNGSTSPKVTETTNSPGAINLNNGTARLWLHNSFADITTAVFFINGGWSTVVTGPTIMSTEKLDFSSSVVRERIWDSNGDFRNPGEDGSYYFADTYAATQPEIYLLDGGGRRDNGSSASIWAQSGSGGSATLVGGLKKQYPNTADADWEYNSLSTAEASGDAWINGDVVRCGPSYFVYLANLASSGHSGLIHKDPFAEGDMVSDGSILSSEAAGTDPDTWGGFDASTGTKGVDYEFDTNGGKARFRNLTGSGAFALQSSGSIAAGGELTFMILDAVRVTWSGGTEVFRIILRSYDDASNRNEVDFGIKASGNWKLSDNTGGWSETNIDPASPIRIWLYVKKGRAVVYADEKISTLLLERDIWSRTGASASQFQIWTPEVNNSTDLELGYHVTGWLTI